MTKKDLVYISAIIGAILLSVFAVFSHRDKQIVTNRDLKIDTLPAVTTSDTAQYIPLFKDGPKAANRIKLKYIIPFTWSTNYIHARSTADKLMIGTLSNYNYKLYVTGGDAMFMNNLRITAGKKLYLSTDAYLEAGDAGALYLHDSREGTKSLSDLLTAGVVSGSDFDTVNITAGASSWNMLGATGSLYHTYGGTGSSRVTFNTDGTTKGRVISSYGNFTSTANPTTPVLGDLYFNSVAGKTLSYNGSTWDTLRTSADTELGGGVGGSVGSNQVAVGTGTGDLTGSNNFLKSDTLFFATTSAGADNAFIQMGQVPLWTANISTTGTMTNTGNTVNLRGTTRVSSYINNVVKLNIWADSTSVKNDLVAHNDIYWRKNDGLSGNYGIVWNGTTQKFDTASLTPASQAWRDYKKMNFFQRLWLVRFWDARKHEAYPLPNRAGVEVRRWDPAEGMYQFEYEMEMMGLGLYQLYKVAGGMFLLIVGGLLYVILRKK